MNLERLTKPIPVTDTTPLAELMNRLLIDRRDAADEIERLREALTIALSALVAATSLLKRSEDEKVKPSRAVASNKIFRLMMADYERAEDNARAALLGEKE